MTLGTNPSVPGTLPAGCCHLSCLAKHQPGSEPRRVETSPRRWPPNLTFHRLSPHYNAKNHAQRWRLNMQMKHTMYEEAYSVTARPIPCTVPPLQD